MMVKVVLCAQSTPGDSVKHRISEQRTKLVARRKKLEADRQARLKPLVHGIRQTAKLEIKKIEDLARDLADKISDDEESSSE